MSDKPPVLPEDEPLFPENPVTDSPSVASPTEPVAPVIPPPPVEAPKSEQPPVIEPLKEQPGKGLSVGGVRFPVALADLGLIDEYEFVVHPVIAGHGPTLLSGLRERIRLELVDRRDFRSGAVALRYVPVPPDS